MIKFIRNGSQLKIAQNLKIFNLLNLASVDSEEEEEVVEQKPAPKTIERAGSKYFRESNNINAAEIISDDDDDDDFEADLQAAQQQMKQKEAEIGNPLGNGGIEENMGEPPAHDPVAMAHQEYNTQNSARKKKKKKKKKNIVNNTAVVEGEDYSLKANINDPLNNPAENGTLY